LTVAVVLLVLVNLGLVYVLLTRDRGGGSGGTAASTPAAGRHRTSVPATTAAPSRTPSSHPSTQASPHRSPRPSSRPSPTSVARASSGGHLVLDSTALVAAPFRPVAVTGAWTGTQPTARPTVHVEVLQGGRWSPFPLPAVVAASGRFTAYAALGPRGQYRLRVVASGGQPVSDPVVVTVR
jgi:hypothetical protein